MGVGGRVGRVGEDVAVRVDLGEEGEGGEKEGNEHG